MNQNEPQIVRHGIFDCQVCVPKDWTDDQVLEFVNTSNPTNMSSQWQIRTEERLLKGDPVRQPCAERTGFVHLMLDV